MKLHKRSIPQSPDSEKAILGSMMLSEKCCVYVSEVLTENDFFNPVHKQIWSLIIELHAKRKPVDMITVSQLAEDKGILEDFGGAGYLADIYTFVPTASNWKEYAEILKEKTAARTAIEIAEEILLAAYDSTADMSITEVVQGGLVRVAGLTQSSAKQRSIKEIMASRLDSFEGAATYGRKMEGIPTGIPTLDKMIRGLRPGNMIVIAAATKVGKSALAASIGLNVAMAGTGVGIFSLEMNEAEIADRLIANESGYNISSIGDMPISQHNCNKVLNAISKISETNMHIRDEANMTMAQFRSACHRMVMRDDVKLITLDYAQLVLPSNKKETREQQVAEVSRSVKLTANELGVPIIVLSQINDDGRSRESRALENDANIFMIVEKEKRGKFDEDGFDYFLRLKHTRDCPSGRIPLIYKAEITRFEEKTE